MIMTTLTSDVLTAIRGGVDKAQQAELRTLARKYCPETYAANQHRTITRPLAERCLDEAGYGNFKSMLDRYFKR